LLLCLDTKLPKIKAWIKLSRILLHSAKQNQLRF
jgi:hypothetical protein